MHRRDGRPRQFCFEWPARTAALLATAMRWLMVIVFFAGLLWLLFGVLRQRGRAQRRSS